MVQNKIPICTLCRIGLSYIGMHVARNCRACIIGLLGVVSVLSIHELCELHEFYKMCPEMEDFHPAPLVLQTALTKLFLYQCNYRPNELNPFFL